MLGMQYIIQKIRQYLPHISKEQIVGDKPINVIVNEGQPALG
jgi:hypothetical protein